MSFSYSWKDVNSAIDSAHRAKSICDVLMDAFPGTEHGGLVGALWAVQRELEWIIHTLEEKHERPEATDASEWDADGEVGLPMEDEEGEDESSSLDEEPEESAEEPAAGRFTRSSFLGNRLKVDLMEEHDDGSATYTITSDDGTLHRLFEAFFVHAMIEGIKSVEGENQKFASLKRAATDLERVLQVWESSDVLDYDPDVKDRREALTKALYG
jgi:hypothetical protein